MSEIPSFQGEIRKFGETVSIRGLPKIIKSRSWFLKIFWLLSVLASLSILLWQFSAVFMKYLSYPTNTVYSEGQKQAVMPDTSICNAYPFAGLDGNIFSFNDYSDYIAQIKAGLSLEALHKFKPNWNISQEQYDTLWSYLQSLDGYILNSLPGLNELDVIKSYFIVECTFLDWLGQEIKNIVCMNYTRYSWDSKYYLCATFTIPESISPQIMGMKTIVYLNNFPKMFLNIDGESEKTAGVRVAIHNPGTQPNFYKGFSIAPGTETFVKVTPTNRTRLPLPYAKVDCTKDKYLPYSESMVYSSKDDCIDVRMQNYFIEECNCVYGGFVKTEKQLRAVNYSICGQLGFLYATEINLENVLGALKAFLCMSSAYQHASDFVSISSNQLCLIPCSEMFYDISSSSTQWPHITQHLSFYSKYIRNKESIYESNFSPVYEPIYQDSMKNTSDISKIFDGLRDTNLIEDNFLRLYVVLDRASPLLLTDYATMTWEVLLSSIGGCLSLWLGVTVMTFVEVFELVFNLGSMFVERKKSKSLKINP